jgi:hypothetical protein
MTGAPAVDDGNDLRPRERTPVYVQPLAADGLSLTGRRVEVLVNDREWEGDLVEGPWVERRGRYYYLFYSGNAFWNASYAVGVARGASPAPRRETRSSRAESAESPSRGGCLLFGRLASGVLAFINDGRARGERRLPLITA